MVAAGYSNVTGINSAEIYDPALDTCSYTGLMQVGRSSPKLVLLPDGKVLIVGISTSSFSIVNAERWDPASNSWSLVPFSFIAHSLHTATLLPNGQVLVAGGGDSGTPTRVSELFEPDKKKRPGQITSN
jgi:WD40 repeat protein